jgi:hypothetical protein
VHRPLASSTAHCGACAAMSISVSAIFRKAGSGAVGFAGPAFVPDWSADQGVGDAPGSVALVHVAPRSASGIYGAGSPRGGTAASAREGRLQTFRHDTCTSGRIAARADEPTGGAFMRRPGADGPAMVAPTSASPRAGSASPRAGSASPRAGSASPRAGSSCADGGEEPGTWKPALAPGLYFSYWRLPTEHGAPLTRAITHLLVPPEFCAAPARGAAAGALSQPQWQWLADGVRVTLALTLQVAASGAPSAAERTAAAAPRAAGNVSQVSGGAPLPLRAICTLSAPDGASCTHIAVPVAADAILTSLGVHAARMPRDAVEVDAHSGRWLAAIRACVSMWPGCILLQPEAALE